MGAQATDPGSRTLWPPTPKNYKRTQTSLRGILFGGRTLLGPRPSLGRSTPEFTLFKVKRPFPSGTLLKLSPPPCHYLDLSLSWWTSDPHVFNLTVSMGSLGSVARRRRRSSHGRAPASGGDALRIETLGPRRGELVGRGGTAPRGSVPHPAAADRSDAVELPAQPLGVVEHVRAAGCQQRAQQQRQGHRGLAAKPAAAVISFRPALPEAWSGGAQPLCDRSYDSGAREAGPVAAMMEKGRGLGAPPPY